MAKSNTDLFKLFSTNPSLMCLTGLTVNITVLSIFFNIDRQDSTTSSTVALLELKIVFICL